MSEKDNILTFPAGMPGLQEEKQFKLLPLQQDSPFYLLQSTRDENICFILLNPFIVFPDYEFDLPEEDKNKLEIQDLKEVAVFCIVNASRGLKNAAVNLLAPVVVNTRTKTARQVVLNDKRYSIRHPLPPASGQGEG